MSRYIDADELKEQDFQDYSPTDVMCAIDSTPTANVTDKKFTDEEIIKALQCCGNQMYVCTDKQCRAKTSGNAVDLIKSQKAEIERLKECPKCVYEYDGEVTEYCVQGACPNFKTVKQIKAEAYKEFAEKVNEEIKKAYNNNSGVLREHLEKHKEKPNFEFVAAIQGKMNTLLGLDDFIDNLLKELGEGVIQNDIEN